ncbi:tetratricopeptide repeat protein [Telmatospirillum sp.]|uniref:SEL1-like repeat protein n=1 Tax=Telmatospirillum sp. TaxID=2079197 RepID=UPI00283F4F5C|nr:tetratricopeptide repeat protein [Telmatospirillum sp.]MDR3438686.1 tetratricopeptide repeat protein [Telmatospirillum sp.]
MSRSVAVLSAALLGVAALFAVPSGACAETAGAQAMARGDYARAVKEMLVAAKTGDRQAQYDLGLAYRDGKGTGRDLGQAYKWVRQAADKELPEAEFEVGQMEEDGEGTEKNVADAAEWYRKAAQHGNVPAMFALGELYRTGEGVSKDQGQAVRWYRPAADKNDIDSQLALGKLYQQGDGVPKNLNDAAVWFRKAAQLGSPEGRYLLALLLMDGDPTYLIGHGPSRSSVEAMNWLRAAADQNYAPAQYYLGMAHLTGVEARLDGRTAVGLLLQAADQGHAGALRQLGNIYHLGTVVSQDLPRAYMYFDLAVEMGDETAGSDRDEVGHAMTASMIQLAKKRTQDWLQIRGM